MPHSMCETRIKNQAFFENSSGLKKEHNTGFVDKNTLKMATLKAPNVVGVVGCGWNFPNVASPRDLCKHNIFVPITVKRRRAMLSESFNVPIFHSQQLNVV